MWPRGRQIGRKGFMGSHHTKHEGLDEDWAVSRVTRVLHCQILTSPLQHQGSLGGLVERGGTGQRPGSLSSLPRAQPRAQWHSLPWSSR